MRITACGRQNDNIRENRNLSIQIYIKKQTTDFNGNEMCDDLTAFGFTGLQTVQNKKLLVV